MDARQLDVEGQEVPALTVGPPPPPPKPRPTPKPPPPPPAPGPGQTDLLTHLGLTAPPTEGGCDAY